MKIKKEKSRQAFERFVSLGLLVCFFNIQVFVPSMAWAADPMADFTGQKVQTAVVPIALENLTHEMQKPELSGFLDLDKPLSKVVHKETKGTGLENESRDREEYRFEDALDYLQPGTAAAVIVESIQAKDLRKLTELGFEVGLAVLHGKVVLFTSGNEDEIRMLAPARDLLENVDLLAHVHPKGERAEPSLTDIHEAGESVEYVISEEGVYAYNHDGIQNEYAQDFGWLSRKIQALQDRNVSSKQTRDLLNVFIKSMDDYNDNREEGLLVRSADAPTVFTGQPRLTTSRDKNFVTVDQYSSSQFRMNFAIVDTGVVSASINFGAGQGPQDLRARDKFTFESSVPYAVSNRSMRVEFVDSANRVSSILFQNGTGFFSQLDITRAQILAANPALNLAQITHINFVVEVTSAPYLYQGYWEIKTGGLAFNPPISPEGIPVLSGMSTSTAPPVTVLPGKPLWSTSSVNGGVVSQYQTSDSRLTFTATLPQANSSAASQIDFQPPQNLGSAVYFRLSGAHARQVLTEVVDAAGKKAKYYLNLSFIEQSFMLALTGSGTPTGFDSSRIVQIRFVTDQAHVGRATGVTVITKGLGSVVGGQPYSPAALTALPGQPLLKASVADGGMITQNQTSSQNFSFSYNLPVAATTAVSEILWGQFVSGVFQGVPGPCGSSSSNITLAANGPANQRLKVQIVDVNQRIAEYYLYLTGVMQNYSLSTNVGTVPPGFDINKVAAIRFIAEKQNMGSSGTVAVETKGLFYNPNAIPPAAALKTFDIRPLPTDGRQKGEEPFPVVTTVAPANTLAIASATSRGAGFHYETRSAGWAGTGFTFDDFSTTAIETGNLSNLSQLTFGLKGDVSQIKLEVVDQAGRKVALQLTGIRSDIEQVWTIPVSKLQGIDLTKVRMIYFIVEGTHKTGHLEISQYPLGSSYPSVYQSSTEITALPGNPTNNTIVPAGATATMAATSRGGLLTYNTGTVGWAGGGFNYDNFSTSVIETGDFSAYRKLIFGLKGSPSRVKLEVIDDQNKKATVYLLKTNTNGLENEWTVSADDLRAAGVNLARVRMLYFVVEGVGQSGTLEINRFPTAVQPNNAAPLTLPNNPVPNVVRAAPAGVTANVSAIPRGVRLDYATGTPGWAGAGFIYDNPATPAVESVNLSGLPYFAFGMKGSTTEIKFKIIDASGRNASIKFSGIQSGLERCWAISLLPFEAYGIDLTRITTLHFIVEGQNKNGSVEIYRI